MTISEQLKEYIIRDVIEFYATDTGSDMKTSMTLFYGSEVFSKLDDDETGLYLDSSAYVYDLFCDELRYGRIIQTEV
ncbi:MAG: hypothetical protein FWH50_00200 [Coriobacteriia bacterium]|nr:hypothetical protein [Coriobacteriia bacterium]